MELEVNNLESREQWEAVDGGHWSWKEGGVCLNGTGPEWIA